MNATSQTKQRYKAPLTWISSQSENVLGILSELMAQAINLCNTLASLPIPAYKPAAAIPEPRSKAERVQAMEAIPAELRL